MQFCCDYEWSCDIVNESEISSYFSIATSGSITIKRVPNPQVEWQSSENTWSMLSSPRHVTSAIPGLRVPCTETKIYRHSGLFENSIIHFAWHQSCPDLAIGGTFRSPVSLSFPMSFWTENVLVSVRHRNNRVGNFAKIRKLVIRQCEPESFWT